ncbi:glycosyltransferase family 2 protein [Cadophora sp. DSE1049]|nr:glycosyltransferase family 2 protein [Cadophora sp. DSE1049]
MIEEIAPHDDEDIVRPWQRKMIQWQPVVGILVFASYGVYYGYRIWCNYQFRLKFGGLADASWIFICAEGICLVPYGFWMLLILMSPRERKRPKLRLRGDAVPAVDVLLTTCGEIVPMILNTVRAACNINYPRDRYRIIICDDDNDASLAAAVQPLIAEFPFLFYNAREKVPGVHHHYKAGNLQSGIELAATLPGGAGEYLATLDADMIPDSEWLRALLPHLLRDEKLGLISPPQTFYNAPVDDPLCQTICEFIHFLEVKKDAMGCAWCTGSGVVFKRFILEEMGGWPLPSMAEDQLLSSMMNGAGYQTAYLHEFMQVGMVPESIISHLKQRTRWAVGTLETAQELNWGFPGKYTRHMTFRQRWCIFTFAFNTLMTIPVFLCYFIIPALLYWGHDLMVYTTLDQFRWQLRLGSIWVCLLRINELVISLPSGYIQAQRCAMAYQFMIPYMAVCVLRCYILPKWLGGKEIAFLASGAIRDKLKERNPKLRAGLLVRLKLMGWNCRVYFHLLFVGFCLGAAGIDWWRAWKVGQRANDIVPALRHLLVNSMLPPLWWLMLVLAYLIPVVYVFFPPSVPDREELWDFDQKTGVGYPKVKEMKQVWGVLPLVREVLWGLTIVYCIVLFVGTFIY